MKKIEKTTEPSTLTHYRSSISHANMNDSSIYADFPQKTKQGCKDGEVDNLRKQLLQEQGYICCYCMSRIDCDNSKIEHFKPQTHHRNLQIDYQNLFIACSGGEGQRAKEQYCDTKKGESELKKVDLLSSFDGEIAYKKESRGIKIYSEDSDLNSDIEQILNLNVNVLYKNRKEIYDNTIARLKQKEFKPDYIKRIINHFKDKHNGKYEPFCQMIVYFLTKKLKSKGVAV